MKIVIYLIPFLLFGCISSYEPYKDSDYDGVIDRYDKCKNTSFTDKVDKNGCSIKL